MKYAMFICVPADGNEPGPVGSIRLRPASDATTVRVQGHEVLLSDGPFVEADEVVAGVDLVEADDLDAAIALASGHPVVLGGGSIEVRPVWE